MTEVRELDSLPSALRLYAKAAAALVPGASKLPGLGAKGSDVPDTELVVRDVAIDQAHLATYREVCEFGPSGNLPLTYPHVLAFPLHMTLITGSDFPFPAVGLVHISNRITQHRPIGTGERLTFSVTATKLEPHPKGRAFSIVTKAKVGDEVVWEGHSTNLRRGRGEESAKRESGDASHVSLEREAEWSLPGDLGRRYGAASGDRNPIHMHDLTAKALGFPRAIAHGMWSKARAIAALEDRIPGAATAEVSFRKPILLPADVAFLTGEEKVGSAKPKAIQFVVEDAAKSTPHLSGRVSWG